MTKSMWDRTDVTRLTLSILVVRIGGVSHTNNGSHATKFESDECYNRNMDVHYDQKNVVKIEEPYLHLPYANFSMFP